MIAPGAKGWIRKYFELVDKGDISLEVDRPDGLRKLRFMHLRLGESGIPFGHAKSLLFAGYLDQSKWTQEEKLKVLLFESLLFDFIQIKNEDSFDESKFIDTVVEFYKFHNASSIRKILDKLSKEDPYDRLEAVLKSRVDIKVNFIENKWWVNSLSNAFIYLDVILFDDYTHWQRDGALKNYGNYARNALMAVILAIYSDGVIEKRERKLFEIYLASANLDDEDRHKAIRKFENGATFNDFSYFVRSHWLLKRFMFDLSALTVYYHGSPSGQEKNYLAELQAFLEITEEERDESMAVVEDFLIRTRNESSFLEDSSAYEKMYASLSSRWVKVLTRNKDKLAKEVSESKDFIRLIKKSAREELSPEEKELVKTQFKDIARSIPALAIFMVPGGSLLLPLILKLIPDLVPTAFRDNTLEDQDD